MRACFLILFLFCFAATHAETLSSTCYVYDKPLGKELFSLYEGAQVDCGIADKGIAQFLFRAYIRKDKVYNGIRILSGAKLYDAFGKERGRVLNEMLPYRTIEENDTCFMMELGGYGRMDCIDKNTVAETQLEKILAASATFPLDSFRTHIARFGYEPWHSNKRFTSWMLMETDMVKPRPGLRLVLVFEGDRAVAVFYKRNLKYPRFESVAISSKYSLVYLGSFDENFKKQLSQLLIPPIDALY